MIVLEIDDIKQIVQKLGYATFFKELMQTLYEDFVAWEKFEKTPRLASHVPGGVIELMPISSGELYSFKYVNGHPKNPLLNKFTVMATGQLSEVSSGEPLMISEMTLLTALRTAATSALAAKFLAKKDSSVMAYIGTGAQSEFQYLAFSYIFDIKELRYYDIDPKAMEKFEKNISKFDVKLVACKDAKEAVQGADIVTTMTADKTNATILTRDMINQDVFINGLGGDCPGKTELEKALLEDATIVVEYLEQSKIEGEIQQFDEDYTCAQLHEVLRKESEINVVTHGIVVFDSVGFALEDYSVLRYVYSLAKKFNTGKKMELIPNIDDVKNLYSKIEVNDEKSI